MFLMNPFFYIFLVFFVGWMWVWVLLSHWYFRCSI
jgi:hypothetical protein